MFSAKPTAGAAFFYHPDGYETKRDQLMGRHAAGESFLHAYVQHAQADKIYCYAQTRQHFEHFVSKVKEKAERPTRCSWISWGQWINLKEPGCLFMPGPVLKDLAWQRRHIDTRSFSICGITHTTATKVVMDALGDLLTAPMQPWDALICTSNSVKSMVEQLLDGYGEYLQEHFSLPVKPVRKIQLPVIPLGVNCNDFDKSPELKASYRRIWRDRLRIADEDVAFLFVGRLSAHGKAHPFPMYLALEKAAQATKGTPFHLILSGWFATKAQEAEFVAGAREYCPSVKLHLVDGRTQEAREGIWFAADVFTSLSDNIQETFGLTPVEAMAAGLPCVVSDWDGYKETVREGIDGFRIPTWMAPPGFGEKLAFGYATGIYSYDEYIGYQSQLTVVDIEAAARAYQRLACDKGLRDRMGTSAQERARRQFDWPVVLRKYEELWSELSLLRGSANELTPIRPGAPSNPLRDDPTRLFKSYPTHVLSPVTVVSCVSRDFERITTSLQYDINRVPADVLGTEESITTLFKSWRSIGLARLASDLLAELQEPQRVKTLSTLLWVAKIGLVRFTPHIKNELRAPDNAVVRSQNINSRSQ